MLLLFILNPIVVFGWLERNRNIVSSSNGSDMPFLTLQNCTANGFDSKSMLLQCNNSSILMSMEHFDQDEVELYSYMVTEQNVKKSALQNNLIVQLIEEQSDENMTMQYFLSFKFNYFGQETQGGMNTYPLPQTEYLFMDFQITMLDGLINIVTLVEQRMVENRLNVYLIMAYPFKNMQNIKHYQFQSTPRCAAQSFGQYYNRIRHNLIILIQCQDMIHILEARINYHDVVYIRSVYKYDMVDLNTESNLITAQYATNFTLITYTSNQHLYYIRPITLELVFIHSFGPSQVKLIEVQDDDKIKVIVLQDQPYLNKTDIYQAILSQSWQLPVNIYYIKAIDIPFTASYVYIKGDLQLVSNRDGSIQFYPICLQNTNVLFKVNPLLNKLAFVGCQRCKQNSYNNTDEIETDINHYYDVIDAAGINQFECILNCQFINNNPQQLSPSFQICNNNKCDLKYDRKLQTFQYKSILDQVILIDELLQPKYVSQYLDNYPNQTLKELNTMYNNYKNETIYAELENSTEQACNIPCNILYPEQIGYLKTLNSSLISYEGECIISDIKNQLVNSCGVFDSCYSCQSTLGCQWRNNQCQNEITPTQLVTTTPIESSKWNYLKKLQCEGLNICSYNQTQFNIDQNISFSGNIAEGQMCSWYFDAQVYSIITLLVTVEFEPDASQSNVTHSICFSGQYNYLCEYIKISDLLINKTYEYQIKANYFRYVLEFNQNVSFNKFTISYSSTKSIDILTQLKQTALQILLWFFIGAITLWIVCLLARRRLQRFMGQAFEIEMEVHQQEYVPLTQERLQQVIRSLQQQEIMTKYPQDESLVIYGQNNCSFCLENYDVSDLVAQLFCGHVFHYVCFEQWIQIKGNIDKCPICNQRVDTFLNNKEQFALVQSKILLNMSQTSESDKNDTMIH